MLVSSSVLQDLKSPIKISAFILFSPWHFTNIYIAEIPENNWSTSLEHCCKVHHLDGKDEFYSYSGSEHTI